MEKGDTFRTSIPHPFTRPTRRPIYRPITRSISRPISYIPEWQEDEDKEDEDKEDEDIYEDEEDEDIYEEEYEDDEYEDEKKYVPLQKTSHTQHTSSPTRKQLETIMSVPTIELRAEIEDRITKEYNPEPLIFDIENDTINNTNYRWVVYTGNMQVVIMSLLPGETIDDEVHPYLDQFVRIESGEGSLIINDENEYSLTNGVACLIPSGTKHKFINNSDRSRLQMYVIYSYPNHHDDLVEENKPTNMKLHISY